MTAAMVRNSVSFWPLVPLTPASLDVVNGNADHSPPPFLFWSVSHLTLSLKLGLMSQAVCNSSSWLSAVACCIGSGVNRTPLLEALPAEAGFKEYWMATLLFMAVFMILESLGLTNDIEITS